MSEASALTAMLRRDRAVVVGGLLAVILLSWLYLLIGAGLDVEAMVDMAMPMAQTPWSPSRFALVVVMWIVMMAAMMLPSAAPMILLYTTVARQRRVRGEAAARAGILALGYIAIWAMFSLAAATLQWGLVRAALLSPWMAATSLVMVGLVLIAAGMYQWTPLKQACLRQCQSPLGFILDNWRAGGRGALIMGLRHGLFCLGCCWMLMLLLFVGGVMNLFWIGGLALYILAEKTIPAGPWMGRIAGGVLIACGGAALLLAL